MFSEAAEKQTATVTLIIYFLTTQKKQVMSTPNKSSMGLQNPQRRNNLFNFKNAWQGGLIGVFLLFALSSTFTGCKKDDVIETKSDKVITKSASAQSAPIPEIRNNRLYFPNQESLENFTNSLKEFGDRLFRFELNFRYLLYAISGVAVTRTARHLFDFSFIELS